MFIFYYFAFLNFLYFYIWLWPGKYFNLVHCTFSCGGCVKMCSWQHWVGCRLIVSYFYFNLLINWRGNPAQNFIFYCGLFWAMTVDLCLSMLHATRENHKIINEFVLGWMHWRRSYSGWLVLIYSTCANFTTGHAIGKTKISINLFWDVH